MIQLKPNCLVLKTAGGEQIPCEAEWATHEWVGELGLDLEPDIVQNASAAVLHYFKHELNRNTVSVDEFADALEKVFRRLSVELRSKQGAPLRIAEANLGELARKSGVGGELFFFKALRAELKRKLQESPQVLRFCGLRHCAKQLTGSTRWNRRCQALSDQIVEYLRVCWSAEPRSQSSALLIL